MKFVCVHRVLLFYQLFVSQNEVFFSEKVFQERENHMIKKGSLSSTKFTPSQPSTKEATPSSYSEDPLLEAWEISESEFPVKGQPSEKLKFFLNYAILAPSGHNTQPWLFKITGDEVELYADRTRALSVIDPDDRELITSCGAALFNLRIAIRHFGYSDIVETFPDPDNVDLLARVRLGNQREASPEEHALLEAIPKRRTNRLAFENREVPESLLTKFEVVASKEGAWLHIVKGENLRNAVADLIAEGEHLQWGDKRSRRELAAWVHPHRSASRDGLPGYVYGMGELISYLEPSYIKTFDLGSGRAARDRQIAVGSPVLAVLGTDNDTPSDWLKAGQALAAVLLQARSEEVWASYLNQPIQIAELRPRLCEILERTGFAQQLLRMGYGRDIKPTPRRPVDEVLLFT